MKGFDIRVRLGIAAGAGLALGAVLLSTPAWFMYRDSLLDTARTSLEVEAARVAESADEGLQLDGEGGHGRLLYAAILDAHGESIASRGREMPHARASAAVREAVAGRRASYVEAEALEYVAAAAPVAPEEDHSFPRAPRVVLLVSSTGEILGATRKLAWILCGSIPLAAFFASMGGWFLAGRALAPVDSMNRWASSVSERAMGGRITVPHGDDEITRLAKTLNAMLDRIEGTLARNVRFVADASHEIRNPLTNLSIEIQTILRRDRDKDDYRVTLESTLEEVRRLSRLADGLLFLARSDAGKAIGAPTSVNLATLVAEAGETLRSTAKEVGVALAIETDGAPLVEGDADALRRLVENLVENAVRYTMAGGRVLARVWASGEKVMLEVSDTGIGIPETDRPHLFERFWRGSLARECSPEGAGLGLAICREIVLAHGGAIEVRSHEGGGTRVEIIFSAGS